MADTAKVTKRTKLEPGISMTRRLMPDEATVHSAVSLNAKVRNSGTAGPQSWSVGGNVFHCESVEDYAEEDFEGLS